jgi:hypothetical protein
VLPQEQHSFQGVLSSAGYSSIGASQLQPQQPQQQFATGATDQDAPGLSGFYDPNAAAAYSMQQQVLAAQQQQQLLPVMQQQQLQQQVDAAGYGAAAQGSGLVLAGNVAFQTQAQNAGLLQQVQLVQQQHQVGQQQPQQQVFVHSTDMAAAAGGVGAGSLAGLYGSTAAAGGLGLPSLQQGLTADHQQGLTAADYLVVHQGSGAVGAAGAQQAVAAAGVQYLQLPGGQDFLAVSGPASAGAQLGMLVDLNSMGAAAQAIGLQQQAAQPGQQQAAAAQQQVFYTLPQGY